MPRTQRAWMGLALGVCVVVAVLGWFFFITPRMDEEASIRNQEALLVGENDALQEKVGALRDEFAQIATYEAELAATQVKLPTMPEVEAMFDELDSLATAQGVVMTSITAEAATSLVPGESAPVAPAAPAGEATDSAGVPVSSDGLVLFPIKLGFTASHDQTRAVFQALQTASNRYFLVSNPIITTTEEGVLTPPGLGDPLTTAPLQVSVTVYAFVYTDSAAAAAALAEPVEVVAPVVPSERDPFASPIGQ